MKIARMWLAIKLVRFQSRWLSASYTAWCQVDTGEMPQWWDKLWLFGARTVGRFAMPLALRLDTNATVRQMVEESWWG